MARSVEAAGVGAVGAAAAGGQLRYWTWWLPGFTAVWLVWFLNAFPDPVAVARSHWPLAFVALAGATIGNATAVGGGLVFIPVLVLVYRLGPVESLKLALVAQSIGMTSGAIGWWRRGAVPLRALPATLPPLLAGAAFGALVVRPSPLLVKELFGPVSIVVGLVILYLLDRHPGRLEVPRAAYPGLAAVAAAGGVLTGWVAIGAGELVAAWLMLRHRLEPERGVALGTVMLSVSSIALTAIHGLVLGGVPWEMAAFLMLGCAWGGRLGPFLAQWIDPHRLKIGFAAVAIADGLLFVAQGLWAGR